ncbi:MAG: 2-oxoacid:acceptor oxidoreductase family protein [Oscillospiraceae bacterium]|jgi:2-oxoglutarate ferredoxin oxidoreductase subunit gamma|nr:2-oxoacid:acceptor oxidoreductase family protein [Oscillospiraceae bacterium]
MLQEIILAGFGGQGVLFAGKVLSYCGLIDNKYVSWLPSYGPEMRGGTANCSVVISDEPVGSPLVVEPNLLVVLNGPSYDKFIDTVVPGGKVFIDTTLVDQKVTRSDIEAYYIPATQLEYDNNLAKGANIILLGKIFKETGLFSDETIKKAFEKCVPPSKPQLLENNMKAIEIGKNN